MSLLKVIVAFDKSANDVRDILFSDYDPNHCVYVPVMGGHALGDIPEQFRTMQGDDDGENLSTLNPYIHEISHLYWAWKNLDKIDNPTYIGLCRWNRLMSPQCWLNNGLAEKTIVMDVRETGDRNSNFLKNCCNEATQEAADAIANSMFTDEKDPKFLYDFRRHVTAPVHNLFVMPTSELERLMTFDMYCIDQIQGIIENSGEGKTYPTNAAAKVLSYLNGMWLAHCSTCEGFRHHRAL